MGKTLQFCTLLVQLKQESIPRCPQLRHLNPLPPAIIANQLTGWSKGKEALYMTQALFANTHYVFLSSETNQDT